MNFLKTISHALLHLFFPHVCIGCGSDIVSRETLLCLRCLNDLPETNFHAHEDNPVEKIFWGRLSIHAATSQFYFTKGSLIQHLMHQLKYRGNKELGLQLGKLMGSYLKDTERFNDVQALVPLPLHPSRERHRGYNQSVVICNGLAEAMGIPILKNIVIRTHNTETQTKKNRIERWQNIEGKFELKRSDAIAGKHVLLVDDVITTGATLEACGSELMKAGCSSVSVATLCYAGYR
ncbi:MAG TPA: ComF family protein [Chitinophagaceae bacterium]|nr:ComF family protein [Chitinophagaceae bacterium]